MFEGIKALVIVMMTACLVFRIAKPLMLRFSSEADFSRRCKVWILLTATAFLSPSFWLFVLVAFPVLIWAGNRERNPVALYLFVFHVIPSVPVDIPFPGLNSLFSVDFYRILALCVIVPAAARLRKSGPPGDIKGLRTGEILLVAYAALLVWFWVPPDLGPDIILANTFTNGCRLLFLFFVDTYLLYVVVVRKCRTDDLIREALAWLTLATAILAVLAIFETLDKWLLYVNVTSRWFPGQSQAFYLMRGVSLRSRVSSGNTLALGYLLAIGFGLWRYFQSYVTSKVLRVAVSLVFFFGVVSTSARGAMLGVAVILALELLLGRQGISRALKLATAGAGLVLVIGLSPVGDRIAPLVPFLGHQADEQAAGSVVYRQRLFDRSWQIIVDNPFFGDRLALQKMEDLRQGEGIIDMVNTYAQVTVFHGFVGLGLFLGVFLVALGSAFAAANRSMPKDPERRQLGVVLIACMGATLVMMATTSFYLAYEKMFYVFAALGVAYSNTERLASGKDTSSRDGAQSSFEVSR